MKRYASELIVVSLFLSVFGFRGSALGWWAVIFASFLHWLRGRHGVLELLGASVLGYWVGRHK